MGKPLVYVCQDKPFSSVEICRPCETMPWAPHVSQTHRFYGGFSNMPSSLTWKRLSLVFLLTYIRPFTLHQTPPFRVRLGLNVSATKLLSELGELCALSTSKDTSLMLRLELIALQDKLAEISKFETEPQNDDEMRILQPRWINVFRYAMPIASSRC